MELTKRGGRTDYIPNNIRSFIFLNLNAINKSKNINKNSIEYINFFINKVHYQEMEYNVYIPTLFGKCQNSFCTKKMNFSL